MTPSRGCQEPGEDHSAFWTDRKHAEDLTRIYRHVLDTPEGVSLGYLVKTLYSDEDVSNSTANYQRVRRFIQDAEEHELVEIDRRGRFLWVEPTATAYRQPSLDTASKQSVETQDGDGSDSVALSNARGLLSRRRTLDEPAVFGDLVGAFAAKRQATEDRYRCYEDTFTEESTFVPLRDRFNSSRRVAETRQRLHTAFEIAAEDYDVASIVTLTTDPARFSSQKEATDPLLDDVNRLKDWLARSPQTGPPRVGHRPPTIVVPEFTKRGVPHVHLVMFGVGWVADHGELSRYWGWKRYRDRGENVWIDRIHCRDGRWRWGQLTDEREHSEIRGRTPKEYLSEGVDALAASAALGAEDVQSVAESLRAGKDPADLEYGEELVDVALYWATNLRVFTCSPSLKASEKNDYCRARAPDGTPLPRDAPPRWDYVGTARIDEFPAHIVRKTSRGRQRPPPTDPPPHH